MILSGMNIGHLCDSKTLVLRLLPPGFGRSEHSRDDPGRAASGHAALRAAAGAHGAGDREHFLFLFQDRGPTRRPPSCELSSLTSISRKVIDTDRHTSAISSPE